MLIKIIKENFPSALLGFSVGLMLFTSFWSKKVIDFLFEMSQASLPLYHIIYRGVLVPAYFTGVLLEPITSILFPGDLEHYPTIYVGVHGIMGMVNAIVYSILFATLNHIVKKFYRKFKREFR
ncbi:MAG: hypothetical protein ABDH32_06455 [Candidatus Caldarchaeales archaeon]